MHLLRKVLYYASLSTPRLRLGTWAVLTVLIYFAHFSWLSGLSLYARLGLDFMPSIGLTRAYWLVLHGDFNGAFEMNALIYIVIVVGGGFLLVDAGKLYRQRKTGS